MIFEFIDINICFILSISICNEYIYCLFSAHLTLALLRLVY